ncbi:MAG: HK97 family phage prohead protease [Terriglobia bacterium]
MIYRKGVMTVDVNAEDGAQEVVAVLSTDTVDRDREVVLPSGIDLRNYRKNPVVLFGHDMSLPVGKALYVKTENETLVGKVKFATTQFAIDVFKLYQEKILRAFSIGFMPQKGGPPEEKEIVEKPSWAKARWIIRACELYEFSSVSVPANPEALATAISKGMLCGETLERFGIRDPRNRVISIPELSSGVKLFVPQKKSAFKLVSVPEKRAVRVVVVG